MGKPQLPAKLSAPAADETDARFVERNCIVVERNLEADSSEQLFERKSVDTAILRKANTSVPNSPDDERPKTLPPRKRKTTLSSIGSRIFGLDFDLGGAANFPMEEDSEEAKTLKKLMKDACDDPEEISKITEEFKKGDAIFEKIWRSPLKLISLDPIRNNQDEQDSKESEPHLLVSKIHLAIIYKNAGFLEEMYKRMRDDEDFCQKVLKETVEVDGWCKPGKKYKLPCELFELPTLHLAMKYDDHIFKSMLQIAKGHGEGLLYGLLSELKDRRGFNLVHLAAFQRNMKSLK